jgi:hypothetical protein
MVYRKNKTIKKSKRKFIGGGGEEKEIEYDEDDFIPQNTEGKDNKCLYYAFFRCKFGDLNKTNESLSKETRYNIKEINEAVYNYVLENSDRFSEEDIRIADPNSEEFQTDNHVRALANTQNTIILIHEWTSPYQRDKKHFTVFEPRDFDKGEEPSIIFMSNRTNNHYTALIPKNEEIYKKYAEQVKGRKISPEEIKKTKHFLGTDYDEGDSTSQPQAPQPKTSSQIKSPPARATSIPTKSGQQAKTGTRKSPRIQEPEEKSKVSQPSQPIKKGKRVGYDFDGTIHTCLAKAIGKGKSLIELTRGPHNDMNYYLYNNFELIKFQKTCEDIEEEIKKGSELFLISGYSPKKGSAAVNLIKFIKKILNTEEDNVHFNIKNKAEKCKELSIEKYFDDGWDNIENIYKQSKTGNLPTLKELFFVVPDIYEANTQKKGLHFQIDLNRELGEQKNEIEEKLKKLFKKQSAFVALKDTNELQYLLVQNTETKEWMLPGGEVDKPPREKDKDASDYYGAIRELREESGYFFTTNELKTEKDPIIRGLNNQIAKGMKLIYIDHEKQWILYTSEVDFNKLGKEKRYKIFESRLEKDETSDYGFLKKDGKVYDYEGNPKEVQKLRGDVNKEVLDKLFNGEAQVQQKKDEEPKVQQKEDEEEGEEEDEEDDLEYLKDLKDFDHKKITVKELDERFKQIGIEVPKLKKDDKIIALLGYYDKGSTPKKFAAEEKAAEKKANKEAAVKKAAEEKAAKEEASKILKKVEIESKEGDKGDGDKSKEETTEQTTEQTAEAKAAEKEAAEKAAKEKAGKESGHSKPQQSGIGLPSAGIANNINNAGRILPVFEPLPVLVGLVGLGVLLSAG